MRKNFINTLDLAAHPAVKLDAKAFQASGTPSPSDDFQKPTGYVAGGSIVGFTSELTGQAQSDVLNSTLLAQLAADHKYDREKQVMEWYAYYNQVLGNVGWVLQGFDFKTYSASGVSFTADQAILEIIAAAVTGQEELVIAAILEGLRENAKANEGQLKIFDTQSTSESQGNFQVGVCSQGKNGGVAMSNVAFVFDTNKNVTNVLFFHFDANSTTFRSAAQGQTLDEDVYAKVRAAIVDKLGDKAQNFIANLDIG